MKKLEYEDETPIEKGDYFVINTSNNDSCPLKLHRFDSKINDTYHTGVELNYGPKNNNKSILIFKYLGDNKVIELATRREMPIFLSVYDSIFTNISKDQNNYKKFTDSLLFILTNERAPLHKPTEEAIQHYYKYEEEIRKKLEGITSEVEKDFETNYQQMVENKVYETAMIDNELYDLDKKLETKSKVKVKK